jgi:N-acetylmuramoyl-L-alanine amidase
MTSNLRAFITTVFVLAVAGAAAVPVAAQGAAPAQNTARAARPVDALFADASAKEAAVRRALGVKEPRATVLKAVRTVVFDYENVVRAYPTSGFCDDALWRAALLAREAFEEFEEPRERATALRLFKFLASQYPSSRFARQVPEQVAWLDAHPAATSGGAVETSAPAPPSAPPTAVVAKTATPPSGTTARPEAPAASADRLVNIKAIRRAVLADVVRVVIELDAEVAFHDERLENPNRVFVDLSGTRSNPSLIDQTIRFDADTDVVRQIRIGRHPNSTTRIVLEAAGVSSYSVYPLYSPFRLVIDCMRSTPAATVAAASPTRAAPAPSLTGPAPTPSLAPPAAIVPPVIPPARAVPPPLLVARRVRWVLPLPLQGPRLTAEADSDRASRSEVTLPAKPASPPKVQAPLPAAAASQNLAGGLSIARQLGLGVSRIVIDPGHGGHDPGAKGNGTTEAEIVLDVALRLEKLLSKIEGVEVVLTRRDDQFVPLQERTAIANREGADLFLSIHANASNARSARGIETYFLNFASNGNAAAVASRENATSQQTMGALQDVVKAIALNSKLDESRDFATYVQREMIERVRPANKTVKDLGVKQAPFVVLIGASMPSVLAEISFVTNPQEAKLLKSSTFRQRMAQALFDGIREYQGSLKRVPELTQQN